jgi:hypothetical protein
MKKHLLFYIFELISETLIPSFKEAYEKYFSFDSSSLALTPISFGKESGLRLDAVL